MGEKKKTYLPFANPLRKRAYVTMRRKKKHTKQNIWGFKGQMLAVKQCPYSNETPGAVFWSERLKWVQWIARAVTSLFVKVALFKKGTPS